MKEMVKKSRRKDREHPCQTLKTMFCLQVCAILPKPTSVCSHYILSMLLFMFIMYKGKDGQKRRRLESAGRENHSPKPSSSGRQIELQTKPDTPMVPSVRSRVQLLTQKRGGNNFKLFFLSSMGNREVASNSNVVCSPMIQQVDINECMLKTDI